jgi:KAP family P-loop domain
VSSTSDYCIGTATVVEQGLLATPAHIVRLANGEPGDTVELRFGDWSAPFSVLRAGWSPEREGDLAFLAPHDDAGTIQVASPILDENLPYGASVIIRGVSPGTDLTTFSVPAVYSGDVTIGTTRYLQLDAQSDSISPPSGAAVLDPSGTRLYGMVGLLMNEGEGRRGPFLAVPVARLVSEFSSDVASDIMPTDPVDAAADIGGRPTLDAETGPSAHIASDRWAERDELGYEAYAYAIARFMTHPSTLPPLSINIQAPWGGGKTTLMRMVQRLLDPELVKSVAPPRASRELNTKEALSEVEQAATDPGEAALPKTPLTGAEERRAVAHRVTVWFNAWKYQSSNQVWAGLADAIIRQIAARLTVRQREQFWLRLNRERIDVDRIRAKLYDRAVAATWRAVSTWLPIAGSFAVAAIGTALFGHAAGNGGVEKAGEAVGTLVVAAGGVTAFLQLRGAKAGVEREPATVTLADYLDVPAYADELGFVHHVEADLRRVLASVPAQMRPIVVFVDDLDRCSPAKVGEVVEAVNLFLAGDLPDCVFVLGMDPEMVAAALQAAHKDVIACLPPDAGIPIGWRFMDKFIQLPFVIPPPRATSLDRYNDALFAASAAGVDVTDEEVGALASAVSQGEDISRLLPPRPASGGIGDQRIDVLERRLEAELVKRRIDEGIASFGDGKKEIVKALQTATTYFHGNPRELKRFANAYRFQYFLWWARKSRANPNVSKEQLIRWTTLLVRWPEVVRWLRRGASSSFAETRDDAELMSRLRQLENAGADRASADTTMWREHAKETLGVALETIPWIDDDDLRRFFTLEASIRPGQRLSDGAGKGLW